MPTDSSIPLSVKPIQLDDPAQKILTLRNMAQQQQAQQQELQIRNAQLNELQRQGLGRQALGAAIKAHVNPDGSVDHEAVASDPNLANYPDQVESWLKVATGNRESLEKLRQLTIDHATHQRATIGDLAFSSKTPQDFAAALGLLASTPGGGIDEQTAHQIADAAAQNNGWDDLRAKYIQFSPKYQAQQSELAKPIKLAQGEKVVIPGTGETLAEGAPKDKNEWESFQAAYAKKAGSKDWTALTPDQQMAGFTQFTLAKQDPAMHALLEQNAQIRNLMMKAQLDQQPTADDAKAVATQIVTHQMAPSQLALFGGGMGTAGAAFKRMVGAEAIKLDSNFNWEEAESTYQLAKSPAFQNTVRYIDSTVESMPRLIDSAKKLGNGQFASINELVNAGKKEANGVDLKKFKTDVIFVGDEIAKILQGGGTGSGTSDAKLKQAQDVFGSSDNPDAIMGALEEVNALLGNRRRSLTRGTYMEGSAAGGKSAAPPPSQLPPGATVSRRPH